jgi:hypothetical protein
MTDVPSCDRGSARGGNPCDLYIADFDCSAGAAPRCGDPRRRVSRGFVERNYAALEVVLEHHPERLFE